MSTARVVAVAPGSPAARAGICPGDEIVALNGERPRDVIRYRVLTDEPELTVDLMRGGLEQTLALVKPAGQPLGVEVHSAVFDQVRTCDNHCAFCFIYQLPPGLRPSLYLKDDDYRLSFLYGNFTTLTRFTEADLERVISEGLSPLHVSIHATDPDVRNGLLRNRRGGPSLRWLGALLTAGIEVHGQIVVCPGQNDGVILEDTLCGILDRYAALASLCVVPLGLSRFNTEPRLRSHSREEAGAVLDLVDAWQEHFLRILGRRLVHAADEYYLLAGRPFAAAERYEGFPMHEDGVGMAQTFAAEFAGQVQTSTGTQAGFFAWVDGAPADGYRAPRVTSPTTSRPGATLTITRKPRRDAPVGILTSVYGAAVLGPLVAGLDRPDVRVIAVENRYFGGNIAVSGLLVGEDLARVLAAEPAGHRYLLPDVCLSRGQFLDGTTPDDLPRPVEILPSDGLALRAALENSR